MKNRVFMYLAVGLLLTMPLISAEIFFSQPSSIYNVGDSFNITATLSTSSYSDSQFSSKLICGANEVVLTSIPEEMNAGEQRSIPITIKLSKARLGSASGTCYISGQFNLDSAQSQQFTISDESSVTLNIKDVLVLPGSNVLVSGDAKKMNGDKLNGFVELSVSGMNTSFSDSVHNGVFNFSFFIDDNAPSGSYEIDAKVYEKDADNNVINTGKNSLTFTVKQVVKNVDIALNTQTFTPGNELIYTTLLLDQSNSQTTDDVAVSVYGPASNVYLQKLVKSGIANSLIFASNETPGTYRIEAKYKDLVISKNFLIEEFENASFTLVNDSIVVVNTGNVPYRRAVEITIGNSTELKDVELGVGETKKIRLTAPTGTYDVKVNSGDTSREFGSVLLTGNAVSLKDLGQAVGGKSLIVFWFVLILVLAAIVIYYYRKSRNSAYIGKTPSSRTPINVTKMTKGSAVAASKGTLLSEGAKEEASLVSLKISNWDAIGKMNGPAKDTVNKAISRGRELKAKAQVGEGNVLFVFSPSITKSMDNNVAAINAAREIESILNDHNKKFAQKISFGIGVHTGELIMGNSDGKLTFTSSGSTIPITKRISEFSQGEVLISESVHRKVVGKVKTEKMQGSAYWKVKELLNREQHTEFLNRFMNRNKQK